MSFSVLLIDDEAGIVQALSRVMEHTGLTVVTANTLAEAVTLLQTRTIKVMITDFRMPGGDGIELCRLARQLSPHTYRLLLSGHVEYALLQAALQSGDVHKFAAKPWNNTTLIRDVEEGAQQSDLMRKVHHLRNAVHDDQPALLTDHNWVIRLANARLCTVLGISEEQLVGRNLFAPSICSMPVTGEAEITRQTEAGQTWLGYFSLLDRERRQIPTWMAITALSQDYRICVCSFAESDTATEIRTELRRYSGSHQFDEFCQYLADNYGMARALMIEFPREMVNDADLSALCYERISAAAGGLHRIFTPAPHLFLIPIADSHADSCIRSLTSTIRQQFTAPLIHQRQVVQVMPAILLESSTGEQPLAGLRARLAPPADKTPVISTHAPAPAPAVKPTVILNNGPELLPVFNRQGQILGARTSGPESHPGVWVNVIHTSWRQYLTSDPWLLLELASVQMPLPALPNGTRGLLEVQVSRGLPADIDVIAERARQAGYELLLRHPAQSLLSTRSISHLPIRAFAFAAHQLQEMMGAEAGFRRLLQKWQEQEVYFMAEQLDTPTDLATARQWKMDWLCGAALSQPVKANRLSWFASIDND